MNVSIAVNKKFRLPPPPPIAPDRNMDLHLRVGRLAIRLLQRLLGLGTVRRLGHGTRRRHRLRGRVLRLGLGLGLELLLVVPRAVLVWLLVELLGRHHGHERLLLLLLELRRERVRVPSEGDGLGRWEGGVVAHGGLPDRLAPTHGDNGDDQEGGRVRQYFGCQKSEGERKERMSAGIPSHYVDGTRNVRVSHARKENASIPCVSRQSWLAQSATKSQVVKIAPVLLTVSAPAAIHSTQTIAVVLQVSITFDQLSNKRRHSHNQISSIRIHDVKAPRRTKSMTNLDGQLVEDLQMKRERR